MASGCSLGAGAYAEARTRPAAEGGMMEGQARKRLGKRAKKGFRGFPLATIAFYGPDGSRATRFCQGSRQT